MFSFGSPGRPALARTDEQFGVTIEALRAATQWAAERARFEAGAGAANQQEAAPAPAAQLATRDPYSAPGIPYERGSVPDEMTVYANWRPDGPARPERGLTSKQQAYRDARGPNHPGSGLSRRPTPGVGGPDGT